MIVPKPDEVALVRDWDPRAPDVAARVAALIAAARPGTVAEHVGSTAVPGLAGKGVVDLVIEAAPAEIPAITDALLGLGFGPQTHDDPFPPTRPMVRGAVRHGGDLFGLHVHVVPAGSGEAEELRSFRDRLRADPALRAAYEAEKRRIVAEVTTDPLRYSYVKGEFVARHLGGRPG
jgi:GrpB-like predicted nucleotidyltransferase (UPF0157 family)